MATKRDPEVDKEAQAWIESVIGEKFPNCSYEDALRDGVILCRYVLLLNMIVFFSAINKRLMNKLQPNAIPKFTTDGGGFKLRENISLFRK